MNSELTVKVNKVDLLKILKDNRAKHAEAYTLAKSGYLKVVKAELKEWIDRLKKEGPVQVYVQNGQPPEDHTEDYDDAIGMLELATDTEIVLDQDSYRQYVKDEWGWKRQWAAANSAYTMAALPK